MHHDDDLHRLAAGLGHILVHALITLLAVALAFSLPVLAQGIDTLVDKSSLLRAVLQSTYEIRVMLLNPLGQSLPRRATSFPDHEVSPQSLASEIGASIVTLAALRNLGKKVTLKFYDAEPLWKLVFLGDHLWVQHAHTGMPVREQPEYVFRFLQHDPHRGFYVPFLSHFLDLWGRPGQPEFDFDTQELVYRDPAGAEERRLPFRPAAA